MYKGKAIGPDVSFPYISSAAVRRLLQSAAVRDFYHKTYGGKETYNTHQMLMNTRGNTCFMVHLILEGDSNQIERYLLEHGKGNQVSIDLPYLKKYNLAVSNLRIDGSDDEYWYHPEGFLTGGEMTKTRKKR